MIEYKPVGPGRPWPQLDLRPKPKMRQYEVIEKINALKARRAKLDTGRTAQGTFHLSKDQEMVNNLDLLIACWEGLLAELVNPNG